MLYTERASVGQGYRKLPLLFDGMIDMRFTTLRALTAFSLTAFPVGAVLKALLDGSVIGDVFGNLLSAAAIIAMFAVMAARPARLLGTESTNLDEYELSYRHRAMSAAYQVLGGLLLLAAAYFYFALDFGGPLPSEARTWQAIATGVIVYTIVLPSAFLVWVYDYDEVAEAEQAAA